MSDLPLSHSYNLARLGQAGDLVRFEADQEQRAAIARLSGILSLERLSVQVDLKKTALSRFVLACRVQADVTQACVVTLAPVAAHIDCDFSRELHLVGAGRHLADKDPAKPAEIELSDLEEEPEEIDNPHYDLARPALEEFFLALDPYPRCPGVEFDPGSEPAEPKDSPFSVLKSLKSRT